MADDRPVLYLLPEFPRISETFVAGEVARLSRLGLPVVPLVLSSSGESEPALLQGLRAEGIEPVYLMDHAPWRLLRLALPSIARHPRLSAAMLRRSLAMPVVQGASKPVRWLKALAGWTLARGINARHVHGHWTIPGDVAALVSQASGLPLSHFAHAHDIWIDGAEYERQSPGAGLAGRLSRCAFMATCTRLGFDHIRELANQPDESKVKLIYHGVDLNLFDGRRRQTAGSLPVVFTLGRLVAYKGFDRVIRACHELHQSGVELRCVIAGDGSQREALERLADGLGIGHLVEFTGAISHDDVRDRMESAAAFALCGDHSNGQYGLPNVLFESMAMGVATLTTRLPGIEELIQHGVNGIVADDDAAVVSGLRLLLTQEARRIEIGDAGRATIEAHFDADQTIRELAMCFGWSESAAGAATHT